MLRTYRFFLNFISKMERLVQYLNVFLVGGRIKLLFLFRKLRFASNIQGPRHFYCDVLQTFTIYILCKLNV